VAVAGGIALGAATVWGLAGDRRVAAGPSRAPVTSAPPVRALAADPPPTTVTRPKAARPLTYRAQRGDSLWRIAAALTGDGRRWRELWPERTHGQLARHEVLVIPNLPEKE
jgi:nucleoid-associated protein YgaU